MTKQYFYGGKLCNSIAEVENAASEMLTTLQQKPTTWCQVKLLSGNPSDGFSIPIETMSDADILNISGDGWYNVSAEVSGFNEVGLTAQQAIDAVNNLRTEYADYHRVSTYTVIEEIDVSLDFSGYVTQG
jgi:hypothetical protein